MDNKISRKFLLAGIGGAAILFGGAAIAQGKENGDQDGGKGKRSERMIERLDTNKDGSISQAEVDQAKAARFDAMDGDKDGVVTREEARASADANRDARRAKMDQSRDERRARRDAMTDEERAAKRAERQAKREAKREASGDGDRREHAGRGDRRRGGKFRGERGGERMFDRADTNKDGSVSREEYNQAQRKGIMQADADGDGVVTREELDEAAEKRRENRGKRQGGGRHGAKHHDKAGEPSETPNE